MRRRRTSSPAENHRATSRPTKASGSTVPTLADLVTQARYEAMADVALSTNRLVQAPVGGVMIVAVPDTVLVEGVANGNELPAGAPSAQRSDGRRVWFFRLPDGGR